MKYIDADQLKAEIERMREINKKAFKAEHIRTDEFRGRTLAINHLSAFLYSLPEQPAKSLPEWKWVKPDKQYPVGITREMDVNGDWQYCMSSGRLYESCQYLSLAELELKSVDAGPFPILEDENAADKKAVKEIVKTVHKEVTRQVKEMVGEQPVEGLEEEYKKWWESITSKINIEHTMEWYMHETARHFAEWQKAKILEWAKERYQQTISNVGCYTGHSVWTEVMDKLTEI